MRVKVRLSLRARTFFRGAKANFKRIYLCPRFGAGRGPTQREVANLVRPEGAAISNRPLCSGSASFSAGRGRLLRMKFEIRNSKIRNKNEIRNSNVRILSLSLVRIWTEAEF